MIIFNSDLDNTLIYSYKHDIGSDKRCVEIYQGREISYVTEKTYELLLKVKEKVLLVPTTTRTIEQYKRINLEIGTFPYALTCNGGILLVDGIEDEEWYKESLELVKDSTETMLRGVELLEKDENRSFEVRFIRDLFVFTKSDNPEKTIQYLKSQLDTQIVDVFSNGVKVYIVPKTLHKGIGVKRLQKKLGGEMIIAAGDSEFDVSMLEAADISILPEELAKDLERKEHFTVIGKEQLFAEGLLNKILETV